MNLYWIITCIFCFGTIVVITATKWAGTHYQANIHAKENFHREVNIKLHEKVAIQESTLKEDLLRYLTETFFSSDGHYESHWEMSEEWYRECVVHGIGFMESRVAPLHIYARPVKVIEAIGFEGAPHLVRDEG